jgi:hypothetical protein
MVGTGEVTMQVTAPMTLVSTFRRTLAAGTAVGMIAAVTAIAGQAGEDEGMILETGAAVVAAGIVRGSDVMIEIVTVIAGLIGTSEMVVVGTAAWVCEAALGPAARQDDDTEAAALAERCPSWPLVEELHDFQACT